MIPVSGKERERERDGAGKCKLGIISTGKGEQVKNYRRRENHDQFQKRTLGTSAEIMSVHRQQALKSI